MLWPCNNKIRLGWNCHHLGWWNRIEINKSFHCMKQGRQRNEKKNLLKTNARGCFNTQCPKAEWGVWAFPEFGKLTGSNVIPPQGHWWGRLAGAAPCRPLPIHFGLQCQLSSVDLLGTLTWNIARCTNGVLGFWTLSALSLCSIFRPRISLEKFGAGKWV